MARAAECHASSHFSAPVAGRSQVPSTAGLLGPRGHRDRTLLLRFTAPRQRSGPLGTAWGLLLALASTDRQGIRPPPLLQQLRCAADRCGTAGSGRSPQHQQPAGHVPRPALAPIQGSPLGGTAGATFRPAIEASGSARARPASRCTAVPLAGSRVGLRGRGALPEGVPRGSARAFGADAGRAPGVVANQGRTTVAAPNPFVRAWDHRRCRPGT